VKGGGNMYVPLGIKTDYSLLKSLIKISDLMNYFKEHNITAAAILDDNLFGSMCFYNECKKNNIKPIIGLEVMINEYPILLYCKNNIGYTNLIYLATKQSEKEISLSLLKEYCNNLTGEIVTVKRNYKIYEVITNDC
jgi:DNA polymerase-3 subunit alpha